MILQLDEEEEDKHNKKYCLMKTPLTTTEALTGATEIIEIMLQNNSQESVMKEEREKNHSLNGSFQMQIPLSNQKDEGKKNTQHN